MKDSYTLDPTSPPSTARMGPTTEPTGGSSTAAGSATGSCSPTRALMGGLGSHEFMAPAAAGEDEIAICEGCGYAANVEIARGVPAPRRSPPGRARRWRRPARARSPKSRGSSRSTRASRSSRSSTSGDVRARARAGPRRPRASTRGSSRAPSARKSVRRTRRSPQHLGAPAGSVGPVGARVTVLADEHLKDASTSSARTRRLPPARRRPGRDFDCRFADLHTVTGR